MYKHKKPIIINHTHPRYKEKYARLNSESKQNGAIYYSKEICNNIIPNVKTDRNWMTIHTNNFPAPPPHTIVFVHNNIKLDWYLRIRETPDLVYVCGVPLIQEQLQELIPEQKVIYLPLSVDVEYVKQFKIEKSRDVAFIGRNARGSKFENYEVDPTIDRIYGMKRPAFLTTVSMYEKVYAIGRCAIEAKILGCEILPFHPWFPDPELWQILDNREAAVILQQQLNEIDNIEV